MGSELAQEEEWSPDRDLNWSSLDYEQVEYRADSSTDSSVNRNLGRFSWQDLLGQDYSQPKYSRAESILLTINAVWAYGYYYENSMQYTVNIFTTSFRYAI